jgi:hypothetical protein
MAKSAGSGKAGYPGARSSAGAGARGYNGFMHSMNKGINLWQYHDKMMKEMVYQIEQKRILPYDRISQLEKEAYSAKSSVDYAGKKQMYFANSNLGYGAVAMAGTANPYQGKIIDIAAYRNLNHIYKKADSRGYKTNFEYKQAA